MQSFVLDTQAPTLTLKTDPQLDLVNNRLWTKEGISFTFELSDDHALSATTAVKLKGALEKYQDHLDCKQEPNQFSALSCTLHVDESFEGDLLLELTDAAGNTVEYQGGHYLIDKTAPELTAITTGYNADHTQFDVSFSASDAGVGLDGQSSFSYVLVENEASCNDESLQFTFPLFATESFQKLSFQINDPTENGKYVCVQVKDKV